MTSIEKCFCQISGKKASPGVRILLEQSGLYDCSPCQYDPDNNKKCPHYVGITIFILDVEEK